MLAGVARGIADNFGIADWIPRVFFIVTTFTGGLGIVLYAACWAFIRSEDEPRSAADRFFSDASSPRSWFGVALILVAAIIIASNFTFFAGEVIWAAALLVVGLLLYLGYIPVGRKGEDETTPEPVEDALPMSDENGESGVAGKEFSAGGTTTAPLPSSPMPPDLPPREPREKSMLGRLAIGLMLLGVGILAAIDNIESLPVDAHPRHYMALAVTILGIGLLVGSIAGRARWLILVGAILVPTLVLSPVFEYGWSRDRFEVVVSPTSFDQIEQGYSIDTGSLVIDLTGLDWEGQRVELTATADLGYIEVQVPEDVAIRGAAQVDVGRVSGPGVGSTSFRNPSVAFSTPGDAGVVILDLQLDIGNIEVVNR